jgi:predicted GNAT family N-acyltransferase
MSGNFSVKTVAWPEFAASISQLRHTVFVEEQGVPASLELDGEDDRCQHVVAQDGLGRVIGTGRLLPDFRIGRMAVDAAWRGKNVGGRMLEALMNCAASMGANRVELAAQIQVVAFYERYGFVVCSDEFVEAGIRHRMMARSLP